MARRNLVDIDLKMISAIISIGAKEGVKNVTAVKVARMCNISSFTCFEHFSTKRGMLDAAAKYFDRMYMNEVLKLYSKGEKLPEVWDNFLDFFIKDKKGTLFYISYTNEFGFDPTSKNERANEFLKVAKILIERDDMLSDDEYLILLDFLSSMVFYYAEKIIHKYIENTPENREFIKKIVLKGVQGK